jgi:hypothetical protein
MSLVDENGTVVVGDWANADGGSWSRPVDCEQELNGVPGPGASSPLMPPAPAPAIRGR